jgi:hypothetical protein
MAATEIGIQKYMAPPVFIPLPILGVTAFECISDDPLALIKAIKSAAMNFNEAHKDSDPKFGDATKGAKLFARWLSTVHKGLIEKTRSPIMSNSWHTPRIDTPSVSSPQSNKTLDFPLESSQTIVSYVSSSKQ